MELIAANIRIAARPAAVITALTTTDGVRRWWTDDAHLGRDIGTPAIFRFGAIEVTFLIDRIDRHGIEMTCVSHKNHSEWLDTHLAFRVIPDGEGTYVDLLHDGFRDKNGCYARFVEAWPYYLRSLRAYCENGCGTPHSTAAAAAYRQSRSR
jgi:uncharacterized protein YndB with AHSA1/START domain